eukprot:CAMPEP_0184314744 /NCGR_PEP_ID=MMETSP1049-20130417/76781_1 /TAXON_ID=77928 /ORGANISM="Proteomonas sulcata, Strain CCMP704" /LENGTH=82 /DNA_ID=CAMNT_0026632831 /DNA_START=147 /DNA_END=392 /DNA_ORIENTATION=-
MTAGAFRSRQGTPASRAGDQADRPPTNASRPATNASRVSTARSRRSEGQGSGAQPLQEPLRMDTPASQLPGRVGTGSSGRLS